EATWNHPEVDPCAVDPRLAVFVAPSGRDENPGTPEEPLRTLQSAADLAAVTGKRVYACVGDAPTVGALRLTSEHDGLAIYGGFDCDDWSYDRERPSAFVTGETTALMVDGTDGLHLENLAFSSPSFPDEGRSSIAAVFNLATRARLVRVRLEAGDGGRGA